MSEANISTQQSQASQEPRFSASNDDAGRPGGVESSSSEGPQAPRSVIWRIRDRETFHHLRQKGRRTRSGPITVVFIEENTAEPPKVAFAIGRKVGGAVERNRLRRRLRAILSEPGERMRAGSYLLSAGPMAACITYKELRVVVQETIKKAGER